MQNKSIVSIQLLFLFNKVLEVIQSELGEFQYSFCSYSTKGKMGESYYNLGFNTASVLIQPITDGTTSTDIRFQYSFCSYSTKNYQIKFVLFQSFNTASVLIQPAKDTVNKVKKGMFQYSFCSYSTIKTPFVVITGNVSIQLLFLFN